MAAYARRLSAAIDASAPYAIIGLSLGGMLAAEMTTFLRPVQTILISSVPSARQLPPWFRLSGKLRLHFLVPNAAYRCTDAFSYWLFGLHTAEEKALYKEIISAADPAFVRGAVHAIMTWNKTDIPSNIVHLHGDKDRLLPIRYVRPQIVLKGGGHLAVFSMANEVSAHLGRLFSFVE